MTENTIKTSVRKGTGSFAARLMAYTGILLLTTIIIMFAYAGIYKKTNGELITDSDLDIFILNSGLPYLLGILIISFVFGWWKDLKDIKTKLLAQGQQMTKQRFAKILAFMLFFQAIFALLALVLEWVLNHFDLTVNEAVKSAEASGDWTMLLYAGLIGPISEELIFRYSAFKYLKGHGKLYAILLSAIFFGLFHGNIVQSPFAFLGGLLFAYVALEFSLGWAVLLHIFNNLILSESLLMLYKVLPDSWVDWGWNVILVLASFYAVFYLHKHKQDFLNYMQEHAWQGKRMRYVFSSVWFYIFTLFYIWQMISSISPL